MTVLVTRYVAEMGVRCSLPTREGAEARRTRGGGAASDTCQAPATSAVEVDGKWLYRCDRHRGIARIEFGSVRETVQVQE